MNPSDAQIERAAEALDTAQTLVVFTGAGVSHESGIPTFRDADGVWRKLDPTVYASPEGFRQHPDLVWQWYRSRLLKLVNAEPNPGHRAIAALETLIPRVVVLTQNVDGLHQQAGSSEVLELHGSLSQYKCADDCQGNPTPVAPPDLESEALPRCPHCGGYARPDVVWFHEMLPAEVWTEAERTTLACDAMLVVGTSGLVAPAALLPTYAHEYGATLIEVNPKPSALTPLMHQSLRGKAGEVLPRLVKAMRQKT